ncbi:hypothetical protein N7467_009573 [Penicillium canescens]|nr:hypothetical protein N7467_009573 [Penicillium canescens]
MTRKVQGLHDYRWKERSNLHASLAIFDHNSVALEVKVCCVRPKHSLPFELTLYQPHDHPQRNKEKGQSLHFFKRAER